MRMGTVTDEYVPDDEALHTPEAERVWKVIRSISAAGMKRIATESSRAEMSEADSLATCPKHQTLFCPGTMCVFCEQAEEGM